jgi:threonine aldolase
MMKLGFYSDNVAPASPDFVKAINIANEGYEASYGDDIWTARLQTTARSVFEREESVAAFPVLNGKAANHLSLLAATEPGGIVFCHECAHLMVDENDGPQRYTQARFIGLKDNGAGKITPETLRQAIADAGSISARSAFCLTNVTERGTVYTAAEIAELAAIAHDADLTVHLDGARIANAAVALNCSLADLTWRAGVDIVSMGLTKNGGLSAEAVVVFDDLTTSRFMEARDWTGHVPSKMRFLSVQAVIGLDGRDWKLRARNANEMAKLLAEGLAALDGVEIIQPVEANLIFVDLSPERRAKFDAAGYFSESRPDLGPNVIRLVTNWCTLESEIRQLLAALAD